MLALKLCNHIFASGDASYKPYVTAEPDVTSITLDGTEDFLVIGCDGLWDAVTENEAAFLVHQHLHHNSKSSITFYFFNI